MKHELFKTVCMKKWMIVLLAMIIVMPLSSDLYAASKKKKKKGKNSVLENIVLATAILNLIHSIIELLDTLN